MAGILAVSASRQMSAGETLANHSVVGFVVDERITLSTSPAGTTTAWSLGRPGASSGARGALTVGSNGATSFTPDVGGSYVVTCTVDGSTSYSLVIAVTDTVVSTLAEALRFSQRYGTQVPAPSSVALAVYLDRDTLALTQKSAGGQVTPVLGGAVGALLTNADESVSVADGVHRTLPALTANRTKTLVTAGASLGHIVTFHRTELPAVNTCAIVNGGPGAGTLFTFPVGELHSASARFDGTNWALWERRKLA